MTMNFWSTQAAKKLTNGFRSEGSARIDLDGAIMLLARRSRYMRPW